ncbi:MAG TPA: polyphosphate kinase 1 [Planctomycetota bacterium]|nr:polyphosphate kinase 1 [Planctomycetota bacterium]
MAAARQEHRSRQTLIKALAKDGILYEHFNNRELSWLEFNARVLEEAQDCSVPLLERIKFLAIFSSNLDEFFMIRVAGVKHQISAGVEETGADGLPPQQVMDAISKRCHELTALQHNIFTDELQPELEKHGIRILTPTTLSKSQREFLRQYFRSTIFPLLTPLALDPSHPFPYLSNKMLCLVVQLKPANDERKSLIPFSNTAFIHVPSTVVSRFIRLPSESGKHEFILLDDTIAAYVHEIFVGYEVVGCSAVRITRDSDVLIDEDNAADLLKMIEEGVRSRRKGAAVRLQYHAALQAEALEVLVDELDLRESDLYATDDFIAFADLFQFYNALDLPELKDAPFIPQPSLSFKGTDHVFSDIREHDILIHHPYESFDPVIRFVREAADDPKVLAIKMTLYRTGTASPIAQMLEHAALNGKQVAVLMELKARFDEEANIFWSRRLVAAGAHVIYGLVGLKTHCKCALVVRREGSLIRRYVHLGTGNYNDRTARLYGDFGYFTCEEKFGEDVTNLFNIITGYARPPAFHHVEIAPTGLRNKLLGLIRREIEHASAGKPARMVLKLNNLQDPTLIAELYVASRAGVKIDLIVRAVCCIKPGVPGLSENIRAIRIVDRFLEHARVFYFHNGGAPEFYLASADWMQRNLDSRIELLFPILDKRLYAELENFLQLQLLDNEKARLIGPDGRNVRIAVPKGTPRIRSQEVLAAAAANLAANNGAWGNLKIEVPVPSAADAKPHPARIEMKAAEAVAS